MKVADFKEFVRSLAAMANGDSPKFSKELDKLADRLDPYTDWKLSQFSDFLAQVEINCLEGNTPPPKRKPTPSPIDQNLVEKSVSTLNELFEKSVEADTTYSLIGEEVKNLGKSLKKEEAILVAKQFGISQSIRTKKAALEIIENRIATHKERHDHTMSILNN